MKILKIKEWLKIKKSIKDKTEYFIGLGLSKRTTEVLIERINKVLTNIHKK